MKKIPSLAYTPYLLSIVLLFCCVSCSNVQNKETIKVLFPAEYYDQGLDGRLILLISEHADTEPRFQLRDDTKTCQAFGMDVNDWNPEQILEFDMDAFGYPVHNFNDLPSGEFFVQAVFHKYETFKRSDGHIVKLPMDRGEGQQWNRAPGNLYSTPQKVLIKEGEFSPSQIHLDQKIPPIPEPEDTEYVKHIKIRSKLLSEF